MLWWRNRDESIWLQRINTAEMARLKTPSFFKVFEKTVVIPAPAAKRNPSAPSVLPALSSPSPAALTQPQDGFVTPPPVRRRSKKLEPARGTKRPAAIQKGESETDELSVDGQSLGRKSTRRQVKKKK